VLVPTKVSAIELISSPDTPKSHNFRAPVCERRMLEGLTSR